MNSQHLRAIALLIAGFLLLGLALSGPRSNVNLALGVVFVILGASAMRRARDR